MKIGLIFGNFNPPHIGHIMLAKAGLRMMDKIIFIPVYDNIFYHRFNMLQNLLGEYDFINNKVEASTLAYDVYKIIPDDNPFTILNYSTKVIDWTKNEYYLIVTDKTFELYKKSVGIDIKFFVVHFYGQKFNTNCNLETWIDPITIDSKKIQEFIKNRMCPYPYITKSVYEYIKTNKLYTQILFRMWQETREF